jgi:dipeptidase E
MKLLLTSAGLKNDAITAALGELVARDYKDCSIAFVPTASDVLEGDKSWQLDQIDKFRALNFNTFDFVDLAAIPKQLSLQRLQQADVIVFGGGNPYFLLDVIDAKGLRQELTTLFRSKIYVGISAGSQAAGPHPALASESKLFADLGGNEDPWREGLAFADVYVRPHLDNPKFPCAKRDLFAAVAANVSGPAYALEDESALMIVNGEVTPVGPGRILTANV